MQTETMTVTDSRQSVFIELRERGAEGVIALNSCGLTPQVRPRGRPSRSLRFLYTSTKKGINVWSGVTPNAYVEMFFQKESGVNIKPCKIRNVATPYMLVNRRPTSQEEPFLILDGYAVVTNLTRRMIFTRQVYDLACETQNAMYLLSALEVLKALFFSQAKHGKIPLEQAESVYDKYDKIAARIFRGQTPSEQLTSFTLAFRLLAKTTGVNVAPAQVEA